VREYDHRAYRL